MVTVDLSCLVLEMTTGQTTDKRHRSRKYETSRRSTASSYNHLLSVVYAIRRIASRDVAEIDQFDREAGKDEDKECKQEGVQPTAEKGQSG